MPNYLRSVIVLCLLVFCTARAGEPATELTIKDLALLSEAVVIARVGDFSPSPTKDGGSLALWIERSLKGRLQGGRDIIWIARKDLPKADVSPQLWLLFLGKLPNGLWTVHSAGNTEAKIALNEANSPVIAEVNKVIGSYGDRALPEPPSPAEINEWIHKAGKGSRQAREDAIAKLVSAGDSARQELLAADSSPEREIANAARTLLALTGGGPAVNNVRLTLEPEKIELGDEESRTITVHFVNVTSRPIKIVTGLSAWGDNVQAAVAFDVRPLLVRDAQPLKPNMPDGYLQPSTGAAPLPIVRIAPAYGSVPVAVKISVEPALIAGKKVRLIKFPQGSIELPTGGDSYKMRVRFECPGPRPDQQRLIDDNYWAGGQLMSNEMTLVVK